jgi:hypothetical protein
MIVHVECLPDETLLRKLGFSRKQVEHHQGKSRVLAKIRSLTNQVGLIDEDPTSAKHPYEHVLERQDTVNGVTYLTDLQRKNKVLVLQVKLEDWIIAACPKSQIDITTFGLPNRPNDLHSVMNYRIAAFEKLLDALLEAKNPYLLTLSRWLQE